MKTRKMMNDLILKFKNWMSWFIRPEFLLTPLSIDRWVSSITDKSLEIFIFGFRIFIMKRW